MRNFNSTYLKIYRNIVTEQTDTSSKIVDNVKGALSKIPESATMSALFRTKIPEADVSWNDIAMIDSWLDWKSMLYVAASIFEPSGVMSWPYLEEALAEYNRDGSTVNAFFLLLALLSVIPVWGKPFQLFTKVLKLGIKIKFFPVFFVLWMAKRATSSLNRVGNVERLLKETAGKFSNITLKTGQNAGDLFKDTIKKVTGKVIPDSALTGKAANKSKAAKVAGAIGTTAKVATKPIVATARALKGPVGTSRLAAGVGLPLLAGGRKSKEEEEDFLDFLKNLKTLKRIPAYGGSTRPTFGEIGQTGPALY